MSMSGLVMTSAYAGPQSSHEQIGFASGCLGIVGRPWIDKIGLFRPFGSFGFPFKISVESDDAGFSSVG